MPKRRTAPLTALLWAVWGCATAGPAAPPAPVTPPAAEAPAVADRLAPPPSALRTADRVQLTGLELGTMWTFENPPLEYWAKAHGFQPTPAWLEHVRLASLRYGTYCSASFVSATGLVMTNHHCARPCVEQQSTQTRDYVVTGFYARTRTEERTCEGLFLDQLVAIEDVTARIRQAVPAVGEAPEIARAIERAADTIEEACAAATGRICQVVRLYHGGQYQLYQYKRYQPVKLVFAPELQAGYFGGDSDNFTYPRFALDVAFLRAYEADGTRPAETPHHFVWRPEGAAEGEVVFLTGNPGSTSRLTTVSQLMYERVYRHPLYIDVLEAEREVLQAYAAADPGGETEWRQELFELENSLKAYTGELAGLTDSLLVGRKIRWEREFRARIEADPALAGEFGDIWSQLEDVQQRKLEISPRLNVANVRLLGAPHLTLAHDLVQYVREMARPEAERSAEFRRQAARIRSMLEAPTPVTPELARLALRKHIEIASEWLPPGDSLRELLIRPGETPGAAADRLAAASDVLDPGFRRNILRWGVTELERTEDPLIDFAELAWLRHAALSVEWQKLTAEESLLRQRLGRALFAAYGTSVPPDATFTPRISDGRVLRYEFNGTYAPAHTTFYGMFGRSAAFGNEMPWTLPPSFARAIDKIEMQTPLNFVATTDITGGNSGSPVIDREGRLVGIAFDGNIEQLPNEYIYTDDVARTVAVHAAGILEALRNVYDATPLVAELLRAAEARRRPE